MATAKVAAPTVGVPLGSPVTTAAAWDECAEGNSRETTHFTGPSVRTALKYLVDLARAGKGPNGNKLKLADIACGSGIVVFEAAKYEDTFESILASDFSSGMCAVVERKAAALKAAQPSVASIRTLVADATNLTGIPDASVDICTCAFGIMMIPNAEAAVREMVRITKPGGLILLITPRSPANSQFLSLMMNLNKFIASKTATSSASAPPATIPSAQSQSQPLLKPYVTEEALAALFEAVGLERVLIETHVGITRVYDNAEAFWRSLDGTSPQFAKVTPEEQDRQVVWVKEFLNGVWGAEAPFALALSANIAIARKK